MNHIKNAMHYVVMPASVVALGAAGAAMAWSERVVSVANNVQTRLNLPSDLFSWDSEATNPTPLKLALGTWVTAVVTPLLSLQMWCWISVREGFYTSDEILCSSAVQYILCFRGHRWELDNKYKEAKESGDYSKKRDLNKDIDSLECTHAEYCQKGKFSVLYQFNWFMHTASLAATLLLAPPLGASIVSLVSTCLVGSYFLHTGMIYWNIHSPVWGLDKMRLAG